MTMAPERLSRLQRRILALLAAEDQRTRGTLAATVIRTSCTPSAAIKGT
jgi:hypothetical protein